MPPRRLTTTDDIFGKRKDEPFCYDRPGLAAGIARDRIPCGRWMSSPYRTWLLWRRMILWQIADYRTALDTEARIRRARTLLHIQCGRDWKRKAPADLVWMLGIAPFADEACHRINALTDHDTPPPPKFRTTSPPNHQQPARPQ